MQKNIIDINDYKFLLNLANEDKSLFFPGDMGFLNYLLFDLAEKKQLRLKQDHIQYIACDFDAKETKKRFAIKDSGSILINSNPIVIHWPGDEKPINKNPFIPYYGYDQPMSYFRKKFLKDKYQTSSSLKINSKIFFLKT